MTNRTVARRYAKGLLAATLDVAPDALRGVADDLDGLASAIRGHDGLRLLVVNPAVESEEKLAVLLQIAERMQLHPVVGRFLGVAAEKQRLDHLGLIAELFRQQVDEHEGVLTAEVVTPMELEAGEVEEIRARLSEATGRPVRVTARADEDVLGGMITRIGDVVYDGSLRRHLTRIREELSTVKN